MNYLKQLQRARMWLEDTADPNNPGDAHAARTILPLLDKAIAEEKTREEIQEKLEALYERSLSANSC